MLRSVVIAVLAIFAALGATLAIAQDEETRENGAILRYIEDQISSGNRRIRLSGVAGALSSQATVQRITIADRDGVWLEIRRAAINWNRGALFRGRVDVTLLRADEIEVSRLPVPDDAGPTPEATPFAVPDLPVSVLIERLQAGRVILGSSVIGQAAEMAVDGSLRIGEGELDTALAMQRLDGPGGSFALDAEFSNEGRQLATRIDFSEPSNGLVATLLNIPGRPAMEMKGQGSGPLADFAFDLDVLADGRPILAGSAKITDSDGGTDFATEFRGELQPLVAEAYRPFFAGTSALTLEGRLEPDGRTRIGRLGLSGAALQLDGNLALTPDGFPETLALTGRAGAADGGRTVLPFGSGQTSLAAATLDVSFGGDERWDGRISITGLQTSTLDVGATDVIFGGVTRNLNLPGQRQVTGFANVAATGMTSRDKDLAPLLSGRIDANMNVDWASGRAMLVRLFQVNGNGLSVTSSGEVSDGRFSGQLRASVAELGILSGLAGRQIGGRAAISAVGSVAPLSGAFDLALDAKANALSTGLAALDGLVSGETMLDGRLVRDQSGFRAERFRLASEQANIVADGAFATGRTDFTFSADIRDAAALSASASGPVRIEGSARGQGRPVALDLNLAMPQGSLAGQSVQDAAIRLGGTLADNGALAGRIDGSAVYAAAPLTLTGTLEKTDMSGSLRDLSLTLDGATVAGNLAMGADGLLDGALTARITDAAPLAALALQTASGSLDASLTFVPEAGRQLVDIRASTAGLTVQETRVGAAEIAARVTDVFGVPLVDGRLSTSSAEIAGIALTRLQAEAATKGQAMVFSASGLLSHGATVDLAGRLERLADGFRLSLSQARLAQGAVAAHLRRPADLVVSSGTISFDTVEIDVGDGRLTASGSLSDRISVRFGIDGLPLSIANTLSPGLGMTGTLAGRGEISGSVADPEGSFDLALAGAGAGALQNLGVGLLDATARGTFRQGLASLDARLTGRDGIGATLSGDVPLPGNPQGADIALDLRTFPLALLDRVAGRLGLRGAVTGTGQLTGPLSDPQGQFSLDATGLGIEALRRNGISDLRATVSGTYDKGAVAITGARLSGPAGAETTATGTVPLSGSGLNLRLQGSLPLDIANVALSATGTQVSGPAAVDIAVLGSLARPQLSGSVRLSGGVLTDPSTNLRLEGIAIAAAIEGDRLTLTRATGTVAQGGRIDLAGTVTLDPARDFPADLALSVPEARHTYGDFLQTTLSGNLTLRGPLTGAGIVAGTVRLGRTEIIIPEGFGLSGGSLPDVRHRDPPRDVVLTLERAGLSGARAGGVARASGRGALRLDLRIDAPNQIFVRGRGLDAEMGGQLALGGDLSDPRPVGGFDLLRGRLSLLGQRITFDEGRVTLEGSLDPVLEFVARTQSDDVTIFITVSGRASNPEIAFSSSPDLPEDEVIARLVFDRAVGELSAFQLAQLAGAVATLRGGDGGVVGDLRRGFGLDDLDIVSGEDGGLGFAAGKYLRDNVYLELESIGGQNRATINLDITPSLKARGALGSDGESSIGIFFERDY
jgi:translocation and assembly module TamB